MKRCGECGACLNVADVQRMVFKELNRSFSFLIRQRLPVGEAAHLTWDKVVEDNPCSCPIREREE